MKDFKKILIQLFTAYWLIYVLGKCLLDYFWDNEVELIEIIPLGLCWGLFLSVGSYFGLSQIVIPKLKYLESQNVEDPKFFEKRIESISNVNGAITFTDLEKICGKNYIITFTNYDERIIKMRTKLSLWSWGIGYFIRLDTVNQVVAIVTIPISTQNRKVEKDVKHLKALIEGCNASL
jgi:hypothetical protein